MKNKNEIVAADRAEIFFQLHQIIANGSNRETIEHVLEKIILSQKRQ